MVPTRVSQLNDRVVDFAMYSDVRKNKFSKSFSLSCSIKFPPLDGWKYYGFVAFYFLFECVLYLPSTTDDRHVSQQTQTSTPLPGIRTLFEQSNIACRYGTNTYRVREICLGTTCTAQILDRWGHIVRSGGLPLLIGQKTRLEAFDSNSRGLSSTLCHSYILHLKNWNELVSWIITRRNCGKQCRPRDRLNHLCCYIMKLARLTTSAK